MAILAQIQPGENLKIDPGRICGLKFDTNQMIHTFRTLKSSFGNIPKLTITNTNHTVATLRNHEISIWNNTDTLTTACTNLNQGKIFSPQSNLDIPSLFKQGKWAGKAIFKILKTGQNLYSSINNAVQFPFKDRPGQKIQTTTTTTPTTTTSTSNSILTLDNIKNNLFDKTTKPLGPITEQNTTPFGCLTDNTQVTELCTHPLPPTNQVLCEHEPKDSLETRQAKTLKYLVLHLEHQILDTLPNILNQIFAKYNQGKFNFTSGQWINKTNTRNTNCLQAPIELLPNNIPLNPTRTIYRPKDLPDLYTYLYGIQNYLKNTQTLLKRTLETDITTDDLSYTPPSKNTVSHWFSQQLISHQWPLVVISSTATALILVTLGFAFLFLVKRAERREVAQPGLPLGYQLVPIRQT